MKKNFIKLTSLLFLLSAGNKALGQVGVNNPAPKASLDITAKTTDGSRPEGILIPRLTGDEVVTMQGNLTAENHSMMVYVTEAATTTADTNLKFPGYYRFDYKENGGTPIKTWVRLEPSGLERVTEDGNTGWRYIGMDKSVYANTGKWATDLQFMPSPENEYDIIEYSIINGALGTNHTTFWHLKFYYEYDYPEFNISELGATGNLSFSTGAYNKASGLGSMALGLTNVSTGRASFAAGQRNWATGYGSVAIGHGNTASGDRATAIGESNLAKGEYSLAIGKSNYAEGRFANAMGMFSKAKGDYSTTLGFDSEATGINSVAIGRTFAESRGTLSAGFNNTREIDPEPGSEHQNGATLWRTDMRKRLFILGNGVYTDVYSGSRVSYSIVPSDAFTILRNAKVGIDIDNFEATTSDAKLQVNGAIKVGTNGTTNEKGIYSDTDSMPCNEANKGSIRFVEKNSNNSVFEGCVKTNGVYEWKSIMTN